MNVTGPIPKTCDLERLSRREHEVVDRALQGAANKTIAVAMGISHSTVRVLLSRAARKFGVRSRRELLDSIEKEIGRGSSTSSAHSMPAVESPPA